jgi:DTW domain-containing protein
VNDPVTHRAVCTRCLRPVSVCYCASLPHLPTTTRVVILQHPRERDVAIGTARMARLCLPNAALHVGVRWSEHAGLAAALADPAQPPILLYPGEDARDLLTEPPTGPVTLVVVDGTWSQARTVVRDNPVLRALPRYAFVAPEPSRYRIRREPRAEYCSTIEAVMYALGALEGDAARFEAMLAPFRAMIDAQIACETARPQPRVRKPRGTRTLHERLPPAFRNDVRFSDVVFCAAEANAWPYAAGEPRRARLDDLIHWSALRPTTGERFDMLARPADALSPGAPFHARLEAAALLAAPPREELFAAFARFVRPTDTLVTWGTFAWELFTAAGGELPGTRLDLRGVATDFAQRSLGGLEAYATSLGWVMPPGPRAPARVDALAHIARSLRQSAS